MIYMRIIYRRTWRPDERIDGHLETKIQYGVIYLPVFNNSTWFAHWTMMMSSSFISSSEVIHSVGITGPTIYISCTCHCQPTAEVGLIILTGNRFRTPDKNDHFRPSRVLRQAADQLQSLFGN